MIAEAGNGEGQTLGPTLVPALLRARDLEHDELQRRRRRHDLVWHVLWNEQEVSRPDAVIGAADDCLPEHIAGRLCSGGRCRRRGSLYFSTGSDGGRAVNHRPHLAFLLMDGGSLRQLTVFDREPPYPNSLDVCVFLIRSIFGHFRQLRSKVGSRYERRGVVIRRRSRPGRRCSPAGLLH